MEVDDLLKLLLIALFLLPGLLGRKKKKEENQQPYDTKQYEYEDPFKDFKEFENEDDSYEETFETHTVQYQPIDAIPQEEGTSVFTKEQIEAALASIARQETNKDEISQNEIRGIENETTTDNNNFLDDFDEQQALIYSEIISPKYVN